MIEWAWGNGERFCHEAAREHLGRFREKMEIGVTGRRGGRTFDGAMREDGWWLVTQSSQREIEGRKGAFFWVRKKSQTVHFF